MQLLQYAYNLPSSRILRASGWDTSSKYDIDAKSDQALADKFTLLSYLDAYRPKLLVLDQPFSGVDPLVRDEFHGELGGMSAHGKALERP